MLSVVNYHYIRKDFKTPFPSIFGLTPEEFEKQLVKLYQYGTFVHPNDLLENYDEIVNSDQHFMLVTFDDGLKEQFELAKPILDKLKIPALFFVNSVNFIKKEVSLVHKIHLLRSQVNSENLLNRMKELNMGVNLEITYQEKEKAILHYNYDDEPSACFKYILNFKLSIDRQSKLVNSLFGQLFDEKEVVEELYMTEKQIKALALEGMLGNHTHSHLALGLLKPSSIKEEIEKTKIYLEHLTDTIVSTVSYPYGSDEACADPVPQIAKELGHSLGFSMERGINRGTENKLLLKRFDCNDLPGGKNEIIFANEYSTINK